MEENSKNSRLLRLHRRLTSQNDIADTIILRFVCMSVFFYFIAQHLPYLSPSVYNWLTSIFPFFRSIESSFSTSIHLCFVLVLLVNANLKFYSQRKSIYIPITIKLLFAVLIFVMSIVAYKLGIPVVLLVLIELITFYVTDKRCREKE